MYTSWSVVFGEQPSAAKWNILGTNDASFNDGTGIGDGVIEPVHLDATQSSSTWAWQTWSPTITGFDSTANSTIVPKYIQVGKIVFWRFQMTLAGGDNPNSTEVTITPPVAFVGDIADSLPVGSGTLTDSGTETYEGVALVNSSNIVFRTVPANTTYSRVSQGLQSTVPFTWANTDRMQFSGMYEAA